MTYTVVSIMATFVWYKAKLGMRIESVSKPSCKTCSKWPGLLYYDTMDPVHSDVSETSCCTISASWCIWNLTAAYNAHYAQNSKRTMLCNSLMPSASQLAILLSVTIWMAIPLKRPMASSIICTCASQLLCACHMHVHMCTWIVYSQSAHTRQSLSSHTVTMSQHINHIEVLLFHDTLLICRCWADILLTDCLASCSSFFLV